MVNRFQSGEVLSLDRRRPTSSRATIFFKLPNDYRVSAGALTKGVPVGEFEPNSKLAWSYTQLAAKLAGRGGKRLEMVLTAPAVGSLRSAPRQKKRA